MIILELFICILISCMSYGTNEMGTKNYYSEKEVTPETLVANYIVSIHTKAILNKDNAYYKTRIYEKKQIWNHVHKADNILKQNCIENGSTVEGRREFARKILSSPIKLPIAICPQLDVYMLPTSSPKSLECVWVAYYHVKKYEERDDKTYIFFRDEIGRAH